MESRPHPRIASVENEPEMFLKQYFAQSRLHFIGSWRNRLPSMVNRLLKMKKAQASAALSTASAELVLPVPVESDGADGDNGEEKQSGAMIKRIVDKKKAGIDLRDPRDHHDDDDADLEGDSSDTIVAGSGSGTVSGSLHATGKQQECADRDMRILRSPYAVAGAPHSTVKGPRTARVVIHLDMDCFFVSAVLRSEGMKHLRDLPVAVAHSADTSYNNTTFTPGSGPGSSLTSPHKALPAPSSHDNPSSLLPSEMRPPLSRYPPHPHPPNVITTPLPRHPQNPPATSSASTFSSSSEISSCNYPARLSGTTLLHLIPVTLV